MANFAEPTPESVIAWNRWVAERPDDVRVVAERFQPWKLYWMRSTGQRVTVYSFGVEQDGTVTLSVDVTGEFNFVAIGRRVFGVDPDDLEECDLPDTTELLGSLT